LGHLLSTGYFTAARNLHGEKRIIKNAERARLDGARATLLELHNLHANEAGANIKTLRGLLAQMDDEKVGAYAEALAVRGVMDEVSRDKDLRNDLFYTVVTAKMNDEFRRAVERAVARGATPEEKMEIAAGISKSRFKLDDRDRGTEAGRLDAILSRVFSLFTAKDAIEHLSEAKDKIDLLRAADAQQPKDMQGAKNYTRGIGGFHTVGNEVEVEFSGAKNLDAMINVARTMRKGDTIMAYYFDLSGAPGIRYAEELAAAAKRGARVIVGRDVQGSSDGDPNGEVLKILHAVDPKADPDAIPVETFVVPVHEDAYQLYDHEKYSVFIFGTPRADGTKGIVFHSTGNVTDQEASPDGIIPQGKYQGNHVWRNQWYAIRGPAQGAYARIAVAKAIQHGKTFTEDELLHLQSSDIPQHGDVDLGVYDHRGGKDRIPQYIFNRMYQAAGPGDRLRVLVAYMNDPDEFGYIEEAAQRGADAMIQFCGKHNNQGASAASADLYYDNLTSNLVQVQEDIQMAHTKERLLEIVNAAIDRAVADTTEEVETMLEVGSANGDPMSAKLRELIFVTFNKVLGLLVKRLYNDPVTRAGTGVPDDYKAPLKDRVLGWALQNVV
jgi:hypothetical protein